MARTLMRSPELLDHLREKFDIPDGVRSLTLHLRMQEPVVCELEFFPVVDGEVPPKPKGPMPQGGC